MPTSPPVSRHRSIGTKLVSLLAMPLAGLLALWAFSAAMTMGAAMQLIDSKVLDSGLLRPTQALVEAMQGERAVSIAYLAGDATVDRASFSGPRARTDRTRAAFRRAVGNGTLRDFLAAHSAQRADDLVARLGEIDALRRSVDDRTVDRQRALNEYSSLIDGAYGIYARVDLKERQIARDGRTLITMGMVHELVSREDALITGVLTVKHYTSAEREQFAGLVAAQRYTFASTAAYFEQQDLAGYQAFVASPELARFRALEDRMMHERSRPSMDARTWHTQTAELNLKLWNVGMTAVGKLADRGEGFAATALLRLLLTGGLGLVAIVASLVVAFRIGRRLTREFRGLSKAVNHFGDERLPQIAEHARRGEDVDPDEGVPEFDFGVTEAEELQRAFGTSRRAVVKATVNEARAHRAISEVFVNLARRNQVLLQRQLKLLDAMERRSEDPAELADLFTLDHLSTRMRRHAEGLVILSGKPAGRTWRRPVPLVDVLRGAAAEVEDYPRVRVLPTERAALSGTAVADTIHLLAELIENAALYSPPNMPVQVSGHLVPNGFAVEVEDRGLGLGAETLAQLNERLAAPPEFDVSQTARLGLLVVGRLAQRHGISVMLRASPYGGTMAIVLIPSALIEGIAEDGDTPAAPEPVQNAPRPRSALRQQYTEPAEAPEPEAPTRPAAVPTRVPRTDGELPRRRRQTNLVPQLRKDSTAAAEEAEVARPPEAIRTKLEAMQRGWQRGRVEAEQAEGPRQIEASAGSRTRSGIEEDKNNGGNTFDR
jgi:signal transduction histidine kinase